MNINWNDITSAYIEMQETGRQCIITLPKITKEIDDKDGSYTLQINDGGDYFVWGLNLDANHTIELLNIKEQFFGDFKDEIIFDKRADIISIAEKADKDHEHYVTDIFPQVVKAILDRSKWVQCKYAEIIYGKKKDIDRMYLVPEGKEVPLDHNERATGRFLQFNVDKQEFEYIK